MSDSSDLRVLECVRGDAGDLLQIIASNFGAMLRDSYRHRGAFPDPVLWAGVHLSHVSIDAMNVAEAAFMECRCDERIRENTVAPLLVTYAEAEALARTVAREQIERWRSRSR